MGFTDWISHAWGQVADFGKKIGGGIKDAIGTVVDGVKGAATGVYNVAKSGVNFVAGQVDKITSIPSELVGLLGGALNSPMLLIAGVGAVVVAFKVL